MAGFGPEAQQFVLELTYNYGEPAGCVLAVCKPDLHAHLAAHSCRDVLEHRHKELQGGQRLPLRGHQQQGSLRPRQAAPQRTTSTWRAASCDGGSAWRIFPQGSR